MSGYNISMEDQQALHDSFQEFQGILCDALVGSAASVNGAVSDLNNLKDFRGPGPDSIKSYFVETHGTFVGKICQCAKQLIMLYTNEFSSAFNTWDIYENPYAVMPQQTLEDKQNLISNQKGSIENDVATNLRNCQRMLCDCDFYPACPKSDTVLQLLAEVSKDIKNLDNSIKTAESKGVKAFSGNGNTDLDKLMNLLDKSIAEASALSDNMTSYQSGEICSLPSYKELNQTSKAIDAYQQQNKDRFIEAEQEIANQRQIRIEDKKREKMVWEAFGLVAGAVILTAVCVATCGAATPLAVGFGLVSVAGASADVTKRGLDLIVEMNTPANTNGQIIDDLGIKNSTERIDKYLKPAAQSMAFKDGLDGYNYEQGFRDKYTKTYESWKKAEIGKNLATDVLDKVVFDKYKAGSPEAYVASKLVSDKGADYIVEKITKHKLPVNTKWNVAAEVAGYVQDYSDGHSDQCQEEIDDLNKRFNNQKNALSYF